MLLLELLEGLSCVATNGSTPLHKNRFFVGNHLCSFNCKDFLLFLKRTFFGSTVRRKMLLNEVSVDAKKRRREYQTLESCDNNIFQGFGVIEIINVPVRVTGRNTRWLLCNKPK